MTDENNSSEHGNARKKKMDYNGMFGSIYGLAFIGGVIYYIQHATSFWGGVLGVLKAIVWPAVLMYKVLELLQM